MEWTITDNDFLLRDLGGVEGLIERMEKEFRGGGTPIEGFRFLSDAAEMLRLQPRDRAGGARQSGHGRPIHRISDR